MIAFALAAILATTSAAPANAYDFVLYSLNLLRFGHGSKTATKCAALNARYAHVDIIVLQEVMKSASPCVLPGSRTWLVSAQSYGRGSYKEFYAFLYPSQPRPNGPTVAYVPPWNQATQAYMRPPAGVVFSITPNGAQNAKRVFIADFHAVWGKTVGGRRTEAGHVAAYYTYLLTANLGNQAAPTAGNDVIIAGDWNLPVPDQGFNALRNAGATIQPNLKTSLSRTGQASQPYDHFVTSPNVTLSNVACEPANNWNTWRTNVSDHLGIYAEVTLP